MTAEIAIINSIGVALAADSAVTIGSDARKIFTSADKLFQLSRSAPLGVMFYGNGTYLGLPWETIVKHYRDALGKTRLDNVEAHAGHFLDYLETNKALLPTGTQDKVLDRMLQEFFTYIRDVLLAPRLDEAKNDKGEIQDSDIPQIVANVVASYHEEIRNAPLIPRMGAGSARAIRKRHLGIIKANKNKVFDKLPMSRKTAAELITLAVDLLSRDYLSSNKSGIVFAGFGNEEFFPAIVSYEIEAMANGRLRCALRKKNSTTAGTALIIPFAQQEMVHAFMQGFDAQLYKFIRDTTQGTIETITGSIVAAVSERDAEMGKELETVCRDSNSRVMKGLFKDWDDASEKHWRPIVEVVSTLPKDELAAMAEALVNLTKFKRRVTPERETVGGPIDVAVITKGDGFVWIKRKHYFDPALNPNWIARLSQELSK